MATQHGSLREFHPESDTIKAYLERTSLYFSANDVPDAKKIAVLLSTIGAPPTYSLLSDLVAHDPPCEKSLAEIVEALCRHFEPKRTVIAERFHFHKRGQATGESVADFDAALRKLAIHCNFADTLEDTLRDRFVCGLCSEAMQRRLLSEKGLSYRKAMDVALAMEAAERETKALKHAASTIHKFASQDSRRKERSCCYRCGRSITGLQTAGLEKPTAAIVERKDTSPQCAARSAEQPLLRSRSHSDHETRNNSGAPIKSKKSQ